MQSHQRFIGMYQSFRVVLASAVTFLGAGNAMATEEAKYTVMLKEEAFELRAYEPHILAETVVGGDFEDAGNEAFGRLFKYISGNNKSQEKIAMTAPVGQTQVSQKISMTSPVGQTERNGKWAVSFMMPAVFTLESIPEPKDPNVVLRRVPERYVAVVRYSGFWSKKGYLKNMALLHEWVKVKGLHILEEPIWARYNAPFIPWFLRRNEILLVVADPGQSE